MNARLLAILSLISLPVLATNPVSAQTTFFAEDLNTTPGDNSNPPLISSPYNGTSNTPNSDAEKASFLSNLGNYGVEDFEDSPNISLNPTTPLALTFTTSGGDTVNAEFFGDGNGVSQILGAAFAGGYNTTKTMGASKYALIAAFPNNPQEARIVFDQDITAFGFSATDIGDQDGSLVLDLYNNGVFVTEFPINVTSPSDLGQPIQFTSGSVVFAGGIDAPYVFDEVRFDLIAGALTPSSGDGFALDDLVIEIGQVTPPPTGTPEPSTLIGLGLLGAFSLLSRRKIDK